MTEEIEIVEKIMIYQPKIQTKKVMLRTNR